MAITLLQPFNLDTSGNYTFNTLTANIKTDNLMYANGSPYVFSGIPAGSNTQIQFNDSNVFGASNAFTFNKSTNTLLIAGNITSSNANLGNLAIANFLSGTLIVSNQPNITSVGTLTSVSVTGNVSAGNILTNNLLYANGSPWNLGGAYSNTNVAAYLPTHTGNVSANFFIGNGSQLTGISATVAQTVSNAAQPNITSTGTLSSLTVSGLITATGTGVRTANIFDSTGTLTIETRYSNKVGDVGVYGNLVVGTSGTGNITAFNANLGNLVIGNFLQGTLTTGSQPNITSIGTLVSLAVSSNITSGNASLGNLVTANFFSGNGSLLSSITASNILGQVSNALVSSTVYTAAQPNITSLGTLSSITVSANTTTGNLLTNNLLYANGAPWNLGGVYSNTNVAAYLPTYTGNVSAGNANLGNAVTANFFIGNGSLLTGISGTYGNTNVANYLPTYTGNFTANNISVSNAITANTISTSGSSGNITGANYIIANLFSGNGSLLSSITGGNVTGQVGNALVAGTVYTNAQPNITSVGTLTSLTVTSNVSAGNILTNNLLYANGSPWNLGGVYSNTNVAAYLPTHTGNVNANFFIGNGSLLTGITGTYSNANVANYLPTHTGNVAANNISVSNALTAGSITTTGVSGNISGANYVIANLFSGNGSLLSSITGGNVTGQVANALVAGTVYTNSQPNITSVGTLANLTVSGNAQFNGANTYFSNISNVKIPGGSANFVITTDGTGNLSWAAQSGSGSGSPGGTDTQMQFNDSGTFAGAANVTYNKTTNTFSVTGNASFTGANVSLGNVSNLRIQGGSANQFLSTNGSGQLSWATVNSANIVVDSFTANGTTSSFTLSTTPINESYVLVNVNGVFQFRSAYSVAGNVLTLGSTPVNGSLVEVSTMNVGATSGGGGTDKSLVYTMGIIFGG